MEKNITFFVFIKRKIGHEVAEIRFFALDSCSSLLCYCAISAGYEQFLSKYFFGQRWVTPPRKIGLYSYNYTDPAQGSERGKRSHSGHMINGCSELYKTRDSAWIDG